MSQEKQNSCIGGLGCAEVGFTRASACIGGLGCAEFAFRRPLQCGIGACPEIATLPQGSDTVLVRNSQKPEIVASFTFDEWRALCDGIKKGEFDLSAT
jgi:hypothetical protein